MFREQPLSWQREAALRPREGTSGLGRRRLGAGGEGSEVGESSGGGRGAPRSTMTRRGREGPWVVLEVGAREEGDDGAGTGRGWDGGGGEGQEEGDD